MRVSLDMVLVVIHHVVRERRGRHREPTCDSATKREQRALKLACVCKHVIGREIDMDRPFARVTAHPLDNV